MKQWLIVLVIVVCGVYCSHAQLILNPDISIPELSAFTPLPGPDAEFSSRIGEFAKEVGLDVMTPASENPDKEDEWASICVVDISDIHHPVVGGWKENNFVYPASAYKLYVLGEAIRQVVASERTLDDPITVKEHNVRGNSRLSAGQQVSVSEVLRLMMTYSDNTAANEAIDLVDRQRASALLRAMGCKGSDITRKYLSRNLEDDGYTTVPGTTSCARHFATFLWATETGAIGGGRGRGLIKGYMGMIKTGKNRIRAGLPESATLYSKTGSWNIFTAEVAIVEDGPVRYIVCILAAIPAEKANPRIAAFTRLLHESLKNQSPGEKKE